MSENTNKEKGSHTGIVAGLSAALAAGAVYFYGPNGKERRKNLRGWILKTKGEVLDKLEEAESVTKDTYEEIVDKAVEKFATERARKESEIEIIRDELKSSWENISATVEKHGDELRTAAVDEIKKRRQKITDRIASDEK
jgi:CHASE3 domain sensor protein